VSALNDLNLLFIYYISQISDEYVRRLLINSSAIERTYLTTNRREAEVLMDQRGHGVVLTGECFRVTRYQVYVILVLVLDNSDLHLCTETTAENQRH
jgi:hypothetical protein